MNWVIENGRALVGDGFREGPLFISDGVVAETAAADARRFDARDLMLMPGICDVHGDGFERNLSPRPKVFFPVETALFETDRQLVANGITTAWLALTISWEPGLRSLEMARKVISTLQRIRHRLGADIRIQLRWEVYALDAVDDIVQWLSMQPTPVLAFNDHLTVLLDDNLPPHKLGEFAARAGMDVEAYGEQLQRSRARQGEVPAARARLAAAARRAGVPCFAHDELDAETRLRNRAEGVTVSEFPLSATAATAAVNEGEPTVLGAPNVLRGGSHIGALDAAPAIRDGLCTVLASDYFYPAQLQAVSRLERDGVVSLETAWPLVSGNGARAAGAPDRGTLDPGLRGDAIALERTDDGFAVVATFSGGRLVYLREAERLVA